MSDNDSFDDFVAESQSSQTKYEKNELEESCVEDSQQPLNNTMVGQEMFEYANPAEPEVDDVIKILVATDIHCGYGENKPIINMDAVNTFEEVLQIAIDKKVDMILLGGDLFHENHPSREVQHKVTQLLRKYCLNSNPVELEFLSDPSVDFNQSMFDRVNYHDENINVGLPIFTIHGNHDDLAGKGLTALDLLHESGLINLFGKHENIREFVVSPLLLRKGDTRLALYGLGSQRDDRLVRAFQNQEITFPRPNEGAEDWFNLFTLHQNRPRRALHRSTGAFLPENLIPEFFDLLVWGHEHESKPEPQYVASSEAVGDGFYILQPGSTVATSLTEDEALPKHAFLLKIKGRKFASKPIKLQTVRPMIVDELLLDTLPKGAKKDHANNRYKDSSGNFIDEMLIEQKLAEMIEKAEVERGPRQPKLPLIRLKVLYEGDWSDVQTINTRRLGAKYEDIVANPLDILMVKKKTIRDRSKKTKVDELVDDERLGNVSSSNLQFIINEYFSNLPLEQRMTVLKPADIGKAVEQYADVEEKITSANAGFQKSLKEQVELMRNTLRKMPIPNIETEDDLETFKDMINKDLIDLKKRYYEKSKEGLENVEEEDDDRDLMASFSMAENTTNQEEINTVSSDDSDVIVSDQEEIVPPKKTTRGRGRGRGSATTSTRATNKKKTINF